MISNISITTHAMYYNPLIANNLVANKNHNNIEKKKENKIVSSREVLSTNEKLTQLNQQLYTPHSISAMILKSKFEHELNKENEVNYNDSIN